MKNIVENQGIKTDKPLAMSYEALKAERDALAVENQALKSRSIKLFNLGYLRGHESTVEGYFVDVHWSDIDTYHDDVVAEIIEDEDETPATDAALAAIEAQGVEKFVTKVAKQLREAGGERGYNLVDWCEYADHLEDRGEKFATELREAK